MHHVAILIVTFFAFFFPFDERFVRYCITASSASLWISGLTRSVTRELFTRSFLTDALGLILVVGGCSGMIWARFVDVSMHHRRLLRHIIGCFSDYKTFSLNNRKYVLRVGMFLPRAGLRLDTHPLLHTNSSRQVHFDCDLTMMMCARYLVMLVRYNILFDYLPHYILMLFAWFMHAQARMR